MLIHPLTMTPVGAGWADARACGLVMPDTGTAIAARRRTVSPVIGGGYGTGLSVFQNANAKRPEGLGGSAG